MSDTAADADTHHLGANRAGARPRVLLLATTTGYQTRAFEDAARDLGVDLLYATDRCHVLDDPWRDEAVPVRFHEPEASVRAVLDASRRRSIDGVLAVGDRPAVLAARVADALGLTGHSPRAAEVAGDKQLTHEALRSAGLPVPTFEVVSVSAASDDIRPPGRFPCVLKPLALSASRGVMRADDPAELRQAFERLRRLLQQPDIVGERRSTGDWAIVEDFIEGREYAVEAVMEHGVVHVLAIFDKPDPLDGPFFEETIYVTPSRAAAATQSAIVQAMSEAARAIGLHHGPIHGECRVDPASGRVFVLEIAARPIGGLCARSLRFMKKGDGSYFSPAPGSGSNARNDGPEKGDGSQFLEALLLRHALGQPLAGWTREPAASAVMMIPIPARGVFRHVDGVEAAHSVPFIDGVKITAKPDQLLVPLPEGASYLGFIFARADDPLSAEQAVREAHRRLSFTIDPELRVVKSKHG